MFIYVYKSVFAKLEFHLKVCTSEILKPGQAQCRSYIAGILVAAQML